MILNDRNLNVLYCGAFRFPEGDAAAKRVYSVAQLFRRNGFSVSFAGWEAAIEGGRYRYKGHDCYSMGEFREERLNAIKRFFGFLFRGKKTLKWIKENRKYGIIVAYNPSVFLTLGLFFFEKKYGIKIILDSTEWYESEHLPGGKYGVAAIENWLRMKIFYPKFKNIICISEFLKKHYYKSNVVNVPPLMLDSNFVCPDVFLKDELNFLYAGNAGKKDLLVPFIGILPNLAKRLNKRVVFHIAGMDSDSLVSQLKVNGLDFDFFKDMIVCHGRVSVDVVQKLYLRSHFSLILRENRRYAIAGFPTKAMESWGNGCPIILNNIGDVGFMSKNMHDSIVVDVDNLEDDLFKALNDIYISFGYQEMRVNACKKARANFSLESCEMRFSQFLGYLG